MSEQGNVLPVGELVGRVVLSLSTGNKLGTIIDVFLDAAHGRIIGFIIDTADGTRKALPFSAVHSLGHDTIMAATDEALAPAGETTFSDSPNVRELSGTKVITASGTLIGHIAGVYVTAVSEPFVFYEVRESLLDALLGRRRFMPASAGHALSDDRAFLIVPDEVVEHAASSVEELLSRPNLIGSFSPARGPNDTVVILPDADEDETVVHAPDEGDETVVHTDDDAETTVLKWRRRG